MDQRRCRGRPGLATGQAMPGCVVPKLDDQRRLPGRASWISRHRRCWYPARGRAMPGSGGAAAAYPCEPHRERVEQDVYRAWRLNTQLTAFIKSPGLEVGAHIAAPSDSRCVSRARLKVLAAKRLAALRNSRAASVARRWSYAICPRMRSSSAVRRGSSGAASTATTVPALHPAHPRRAILAAASSRCTRRPGSACRCCALEERGSGSFPRAPPGSRARALGYPLVGSAAARACPRAPIRIDPGSVAAARAPCTSCRR